MVSLLGEGVGAQSHVKGYSLFIIKWGGIQMPLTYHAISLYNENLAQLNITALLEGPNPI